MQGIGDYSEAAGSGRAEIRRGAWLRPHLRRIFGNITLGDRWPIIAIIIFYLMARIGGGHLPSVLFRVTLGFWVCTYVWVRLMVKNLTCIYDSDLKALQREQRTRLDLRFDNEGFLPITRLNAVTRVPGTTGEDDEWRVVTAVPSVGSRLSTRRTSLREHGHYRLGPVNVTVGDPFGWFAGEVEVYGDRYITVYPQVLPVQGSDLPLRRPFGSMRTRIRSFADPSDLADIRPMRPGDNPKHIHWPTSARHGELYIREFELTASGEVYVMIDLSNESEEDPYMADPNARPLGVFPTTEAKERAFDLTAGLMARCLRDDLAVGLLARGRRDYSAEPGKGPERFRTALHSLARAQPDCPLSTDIILEQVGHSISSGSTLLLVTGRLTPALSSRLSSMMQLGLGVGVFIVTDVDQEDEEAAEESDEASDKTAAHSFRCWTVPAQSRYVMLDYERGQSKGIQASNVL